MKDEKIAQALRYCSDPDCKDCPTCKYVGLGDCLERLVADAADLIERLTAENEELRKEIEWKDMVISLAQRKQADAEAARDALLGKWISVEEKLPELGTRVIATDGVFVGEAIFARDSRWSGYGGGILRDCIGSVVTHWMPLPEAPEE